MEYEELEFRIPQELEDYEKCSDFATNHMGKIINEAIENKHNKIIINTNLKFGLPVENINKVASPFVKAWASDKFNSVIEDDKNRYDLENVEACGLLNMADIILQFKIDRNTQSAVTAHVDIKSSAADIKTSGKSPNITSFAKIRGAYVDDSDYMFIILSLEHKVYITKDADMKTIIGVIEVVDYNAYDFKYISSKDLRHNIALGTGQIQIKYIHNVSLTKRTTWEFCRLLDQKFIDRKGYQNWLKLAQKHEWIK